MAFAVPRIPDSKYISCIAGCIILWIFFGIRQSFGLLLLPITTEYGWDRSTFSIAAALLQLFWGVSQPFIAFLAERKIGFGRVIFVSSVVYAVGILIMHFCTQSLSGLFIFAMGIVIGGAAGGNSFPVVLSSIGRRFPQGSKRQSLAFGVVSSTGSLGQGCFLPIANAMITSLGWKWSLIVFAIIAFAVSPLAIFLRTVEQMPSESIVKSDEEQPEEKLADQIKEDKPDSVNNSKEVQIENADISNQPQTIKAALKEALSSVTFLLITLGFTVCGFHVSFIATHLPAYLEGHGIDSSLAAWSVSILGFGSCVGTVAMGWLCTKFRPKYLLTCLYFGRAIILAIFIWVPISLTTIFVFSVIFGLLWLSTVPVTTKFVGDVFGFRYLGTLTSITFVGHQIGAFCGAYIGGLEFDASGSYTRMWYASLALGIFAGIANLVASDKSLRGHHPQPIKEVEA
ncbi:major facilitator superfamily domain-containing protein [Umbelopsis sp. PMI_123]|nr:major facilitator superfamily domain-containing protein [Umbelopsis sp. PMI_123]